MANITMDSKILASLLSNGFELRDDGTLVRNSGSISNYSKVKIFQPRDCETLDGIRDKFCYVEYEEAMYPSYVEIDHRTIIERSVRESRLLDWLKHPLQ